MGLDLWFREDIDRILASTRQTMNNSLGTVAPLDPDVADAYQRGFEAALLAVGIAFGVCLPRTNQMADQGPFYRAAHIVDGQASSYGLRRSPRRKSNGLEDF